MVCTNPGGCTLDPESLAERIEPWRGLSARATRRDVEGDRIVATYPSEAALLQTLHDLIAAEGDCCTFLLFEVVEGPDETRVELRFPPEARPLLEQVFAPTAARNDQSSGR